LTESLLFFRFAASAATVLSSCEGAWLSFC
jgi:hypothetical protein